MYARKSQYRTIKGVGSHDTSPSLMIVFRKTPRTPVSHTLPRVTIMNKYDYILWPRVKWRNIYLPTIQGYCTVFRGCLAQGLVICSSTGPRWRHRMEIFPRYWPFVRGIYRSPVDFPHKGQWRRALMLYKGPVTRKIYPFDDVIIR